MEHVESRLSPDENSTMNAETAAAATPQSSIRWWQRGATKAHARPTVSAMSTVSDILDNYLTYIAELVDLGQRAPRAIYCRPVATPGARSIMDRHAVLVTGRAA